VCMCVANLLEQKYICNKSVHEKKPRELKNSELERKREREREGILKMALEDSRYCYSPTAVESNSPALPNSPNSFSRNSSTASSPTTVCEYTVHINLPFFNSSLALIKIQLCSCSCRATITDGWTERAELISYYFSVKEFVINAIFSPLSLCVFLCCRPGDIKMNPKHGLVVDDEDMEINVDDDEDDLYAKNYKSMKSDSLNIGKFSFSITNILSDSFGPTSTVKTPITTTFKTENCDQSDNRSIFRPFEIKNFICNSANNSASNRSFVQNLTPSSVFLNSFRLSDIFDYSTKSVVDGSNNNSNSIKSDSSVRVNSLYNNFASYPKIQEEILNSHRRYSSPVAANNNNNLLSSAAALKIPTAIGGLCKTISQIGQESSAQSLSTTSSTSSSSSSLGAKSTQGSNSIDTLKLQQASTESVDSDDCQSEAKKDDQKMWPAWVS
jgi:hypothetical protein